MQLNNYFCTHYTDFRLIWRSEKKMTLSTLPSGFFRHGRSPENFISPVEARVKCVLWNSFTTSGIVWFRPDNFFTQTAKMSSWHEGEWTNPGRRFGNIFVLILWTLLPIRTRLEGPEAHFTLRCNFLFPPGDIFLSPLSHPRWNERNGCKVIRCRLLFLRELVPQNIC